VGGKGNIARTLLPEDHRQDPVHRSDITRSGCGHAMPSTFVTGYRYAEMGYTAGFEPALLPINARQAHMEMADIPIWIKAVMSCWAAMIFTAHVDSQKRPKSHK